MHRNTYIHRNIEKFESEIGVIVGEEVKRFMEKIASIMGGVKSRIIRSMDEFIEEAKA